MPATDLVHNLAASQEVVAVFLLSDWTTSEAALVPSSIAPSMKLLHPTAQSALANSTLP